MADPQARDVRQQVEPAHRRSLSPNQRGQQGRRTAGLARSGFRAREFLDRLATDDAEPEPSALVVGGGFGTGKSHLLGYLREIALADGFVASAVVVSKETPLFDLPKLLLAALHRIEDLVSIREFVAPGRYVPRTMLAGLRGVLDDVQLRRRRREVLVELPSKTVSEIGVECCRRQRAG